MKFYNHKQKKELKKRIEKNWEAQIEIGEIIEAGKNKLYLVSKDVNKLNLRRMRIETSGTYFARYDKRGELRLSIEGSMIVGPKAKKNVVKLNDEELAQWIRGINLDKETEKTGYVLLKHGTDYVGCGKSYSQGILNHVPKNRRIKNL